MFSLTCEYALRAVVVISSSSKEKDFVSVDFIIEKTDVPRPFMLKILQHLVRSNIVSSKKGPKGGFFMTAENKSKTLRDVVVAMDGEKLYTDCVMGLKQCKESNPCPLHKYFKSIRKDIIRMIEKHTLGDLGDKINQGELFLKLGD